MVFTPLPTNVPGMSTQPYGAKFPTQVSMIPGSGGSAVYSRVPWHQKRDGDAGFNRAGGVVARYRTRVWAGDANIAVSPAASGPTSSARW